MSSLSTDVSRATVITLRTRLAEAEACIHRLEEANQRLQASALTKDEFLAEISHELRNPLGILMGYLTMLQCGELAAEARQFTGEMKRSANRMHALVDDLLDATRMRAGTLAIDPRPIALIDVVEEALAAWAPRAREKALRLDAVIPDDMVVCIDAHRIWQVLCNMLGNAVKFTDAGSISVSAERQGERVCVKVTDTGRGIKPEGLAWVFDRFVQVGSSLTQRADGVGLGLAISKTIVGAHGGEIGVMSELGVGSCFWFTLPLTAS